MKGIKISLIVTMLTILSSLPAQSQGAAVVTDPGTMAQRGAQFSTNLENFFSQLANAESQLNTMLESTEWLEKAYSAFQIVGLAPEVQDMYNLILNYKSLLSSCIADVQTYSEYGLISTSQLQYSASLLSNGFDMVLSDIVKRTGQVLTTDGLTYAERLDIITQGKEALRKEVHRLRNLQKVNNAKAAAKARLAGNEAAKRLVLPGSGDLNSLENLASSLHENNRYDAAVEQVKSDPVVQELYARAKKRQSKASGSEVSSETVASSGKSYYVNAINIASILIGISAALFLVIALERRNRGEGQSRDAIFKVCLGALFGIIALQLVSKYLLY